MNHIEGITVPTPQEEALPVLFVVAEDAVESAELVLEIAHLVCGRMNFLKSPLSLQVEIFIQNLNYKLGYEHLDVCLVAISNFESLTVHLAHVVVVPLTELVHTSDEVVTLVGQVGQLIVHRALHVLIFDLLGPQSVELFV